VGKLENQKMSFTFTIKEKKYCFLHIPKNGGKSIIKYLRNENINISRPLVKHASFLETEKELEKNYNYFCILRDPYSRMVSYFSYIKQKSLDHGQVQAKKIADKEGFSGFVDYVTKGSPPDVFRPQKEYIKDEAGNILEKNIRYLKLENIKDDVKGFMEEICFEPKTAYPHINQSKHSSTDSFYKNKEDREKVYRFEEEIFNKFKY